MNTKILKLTIIVFSLYSIVCGLWTTSYAAPPGKLSYQGKLTDSAGNPLNGTYKIVFKIYDAPSGGNKLWEEIYDPSLSGSRGVSINKGVFNELLGSLNNGTGIYRNLKDIYFTQQCWLSIQVGSDTEMTQRQEIASAAYAFRAEAANSLTSILPVSAGGTGATTVAGARSNLGVGTASIQAYATPGTYTWTCPANVTMVFLTMCGGGGGGGGGVGHPGTPRQNCDYGSGGGGASSEVMINIPYSVTPGQTYVISVGNGGVGGVGRISPSPADNGTNGGNTSFGTLTCRGGGGGGGAGIWSGTVGQRGNRGIAAISGPTCTNNTIGAIAGGDGDKGCQWYAQHESGNGGRGCSSSMMGVGGTGGTETGTQRGGDATAYGAGGGGGAGYQNSSGNGGNGSPGICVIMY